MPGKPRNLDEYLTAYAESLRYPVKQKYQLNLNLIDQEVAGSEFVTELQKLLPEAQTSYSPHQNLLFPFGAQPPQIVAKSYESTLDKCYRQNCVYNRDFPKEPDSGFITGNNLYESINDLVRCRLVCRYMDGPEFICGKLRELADKLGLESEVRSMSSERGYYAWHFYVRLPASVIVDSDVEQKLVHLEIQVTTQLAEVLTALTHQLYETERSAPSARKDDSWKWRPSETRFKSAFLGHTLHMLEGIILTLKEEVLDQSHELRNSTDRKGVIDVG